MLVVVEPVDAVSLLLVAVSQLSLAEAAVAAVALPVAVRGEVVLAVVLVVLLGHQPEAPLPVLEPEILPKTKTTGKTSLVTPAPNQKKKMVRSHLPLPQLPPPADDEGSSCRRCPAASSGCSCPTAHFYCNPPPVLRCRR